MMPEEKFIEQDVVHITRFVEASRVESGVVSSRVMSLERAELNAIFKLHQCTVENDVYVRLGL
ncbi:hypothetical protein PM082_002160 [Marasmius tenuissimus]|nr:hypothetical protein PM082_002160 [Marasmius tenuissimus]